MKRSIVDELGTALAEEINARHDAEEAAAWLLHALLMVLATDCESASNLLYLGVGD